MSKKLYSFPSILICAKFIPFVGPNYEKLIFFSVIFEISHVFPFYEDPNNPTKQPS